MLTQLQTISEKQFSLGSSVRTSAYGNGHGLFHPLEAPVLCLQVTKTDDYLSNLQSCSIAGFAQAAVA
jgi:hypothetical protein